MEQQSTPKKSFNAELANKSLQYCRENNLITQEMVDRAHKNQTLDLLMARAIAMYLHHSNQQ